MSSRVLKCFPNSSVIEEDGGGLLRSGSIAGTAVLEVTSIEPSIEQLPQAIHSTRKDPVSLSFGHVSHLYC